MDERQKDPTSGAENRVTTDKEGNTPIGGTTPGGTPINRPADEEVAERDAVTETQEPTEHGSENFGNSGA
jgi:hypothetical protein